MQNAECKIVVLPSAMIKIMRFAHTIILHFEFCIPHFIPGKDDIHV